MSSKLLHIFFLCVFLMGIVNGYTRSYNRKGSGYSESVHDNSEQTDEERIAAKHAGVNLTAWGIVFIILTVILIGLAGYYIAIFYPLLCKKQRKYDVIELTQVKSNNNKGVTNSN